MNMSLDINLNLGKKNIKSRIFVDLKFIAKAMCMVNINIEMIEREVFLQKQGAEKFGLWTPCHCMDTTY